ncbi:MAG: ABC transporter ATP-binding protein [Planctomycetota bacterium]
MTDTPLVELDAVERGFGETSADGTRTTPVLRGVSLQVERGTSLAIVGPSGSGKSTLLQLMGALDEPDRGRVLLDGRDLAELDNDERADLRNASIGFVFQAHHLLPQCTALENALVPTLAHARADRSAVVDRAKTLLNRVGLGDRADHRPGQLSGGECQRVAVVRALINQPDLVLADEPTGSLDAATADAIAELLVDLVESEGRTLVVVTHAERLANRCARTCTLVNGMLVGTGAPA